MTLQLLEDTTRNECFTELVKVSDVRNIHAVHDGMSFFKSATTEHKGLMFTFHFHLVLAKGGTHVAATASGLTAVSL